MLQALAWWLVERAKRRVYSGGHLLHADGSLYMGRYALIESRFLHIRVHHLATPDLDRHLHDHPWNFVSLLLSGSYTEARPVTVDPCFNGDAQEEDAWITVRRPGSIAFRRATHRHRITSVEPETYSLFITGPKLQWWGFFTPEGKVFWKNYPSCHAADAAGVIVEERE